MKASELRQKYIEFYKSKGHLQLPGSPLPPVDALGNPDTSTLFTSAGMQQFKPYFAGAAVPPSGRICTVQKCVRTSDIDSVGDTSHCTFFEMLGNFSFGDYFKAEVIPWTWEFLTVVCGIDAERLNVTVYKEDDEAFSIWHNVVGLSEDRIHRLEADKNYWPANVIEDGPDGPCGPCSEYFYRVAPLEEMCADTSLTSTERFLVDDEAGRWLELGNNVFTMFDRSVGEDGVPVLTPLPKKNNDTGMGFDRIAFVVQGKTSVFETDLFHPILQKVEALSGKTYTGGEGENDFAFRVVAEHVRSMTFCIADGILPGNEGRGYVLRYIMRRAIRYGKTVLGFNEPFLHLVAPVVVAQMGDFYTELKEREELILRTILDEEDRFLRTLDSGMAKLIELLETPEVAESKVLPGGRGGAFTLYDTYGFPIKLTQEMAEERGITVDMAAFEAANLEHSERSKAASGEKEVFGDYNALIPELQKQFPQTEFVGYDTLDIDDAKILAIVKGGTLIQKAEKGDEVEIILDHTTFYAESGGQVGDRGEFYPPDGNPDNTFDVLDTKKLGGYFLHRGTVTDGVFTVGDAIDAYVDPEKRRNTARNHTATHLLQAALRQVLGNHVYQKGSSVNSERLRFDFTHSAPIAYEDLRKIEAIVNEEITIDTEVATHINVPIEDAKAMGAMALFGEKYGDRVRVVEVPEFSTELCGGTHVRQTSEIGLFRIVSEGGVAAGVRRIEAVTGAGAIAYVSGREEVLDRAASLLKVKPTDLVSGIERLQTTISDLKRTLAEAKKGGGLNNRLEIEPVMLDGVTLLVKALPSDFPETPADFANTLAQDKTETIIVLGAETGGKVVFVAKVTKDLLDRGYHAGNLIREVAKIAGGNGGGKPDFASAGGKEVEKIGEALSAVPELITKMRG